MFSGSCQKEEMSGSSLQVAAKKKKCSVVVFRFEEMCRSCFQVATKRKKCSVVVFRLEEMFGRCLSFCRKKFPPTLDHCMAWTPARPEPVVADDHSPSICDSASVADSAARSKSPVSRKMPCKPFFIVQLSLCTGKQGIFLLPDTPFKEDQTGKPEPQQESKS